MFRECYALEKIHGTSARVFWRDRQLRFNEGGADLPDGASGHAGFVAMFSPDLGDRFRALGHADVRIHGEHYGGTILGQGWRYGDQRRFVAFEVRIGDLWLSVPQAADVAQKLGLPFVPYQRVSTDLAALDSVRDAPSEQARRDGVDGDRPREGVVLRPLIELTRNNGTRIIAKYKGDAHRETRTPRVIGAAPLAMPHEADSIALEWVTDERLLHVLQRVPPPHTRSSTAEVCRLMVEDVLREGHGEVEDTKVVRKGIATAAAAMFHRRINACRDVEAQERR